MATIDGIGLAEPSTITKSLAGIPITRNSSVTYQEVLSIGSPNSTTLLSLAEVTDAAPASTTMGLVTRQAGPVTVAQSTAADLLATVSLASTGNTVLARLTTSSGGSLEGSTETPITGALGLHVRPVSPSLTTLNSTAGSDSIATLVSSQATTKAFVCAYTVNSTVAGPVQGGFYAGATLVWPVTLWASGGVVKDAQAVPHPSYLFAGSTGVALSFNLDSTGHCRVAVTYWTGA